MTNTYEGDTICIEEMPQGCVISYYFPEVDCIVISSIKDAEAVIESLQKMIKSWDMNGTLYD